MTTPDPSPVAPTFTCTFADPDFLKDPYPVFEQMRATGPVLYNDAVDRYMVTGYRHAATVLGDARKFNSQKTHELLRKFFGGVTMGVLDDERHAKLRGIWAHDFQREALLRERQNLVEGIVRTRVAEYVEALKSGEVVDAVRGMTRDIPVHVVCALLGIGDDMVDQVIAWSDAMSGIGDGEFDKTERGAEMVRKGTQASEELFAYLAAQLPHRRSCTADDLFTQMVHSPYGAAGMSDEEIVASNTQIAFAGNDTSAKLMATLLVALGMHPDQRRAIAADRSLIPQAVEEAHRWRSITQTMPRNACSDESTIAGVRIPIGAAVMPLQGAANRDPSRWENPQEFDIFREQKPHLGFGFGRHSCLGLNLARMEVQTMLDTFLDAVPEYQLAGEITYTPAFALRGPAAVPIAVA